MKNQNNRTPIVSFESFLIEKSNNGYALNLLSCNSALRKKSNHHHVFFHQKIFLKVTAIVKAVFSSHFYSIFIIFI